MARENDSNTRVSYHLLVAASTQDDAELVESHLRNAGHAVRTHWVATPDKAYETLGQLPADLVLCADDVTSTGALPVLEVCRKRAPRVPVVVVSNVRNMERLVSMMRGGARDVVSRRNLEHLELAILRELQAYRQAQDLADARHRLQDLETRHQKLFQDTDQALAYVQEGILTSVNPAFRALLGYAPGARLDGAPVMDLVAPSDHQQIKRRLHSHNAREDQVQIRLKRADGSELAVTVGIQPVEIGGELQIALLVQAAETATVPAPPRTGRDALYEHLAQLADLESAHPAEELIFIRADGVELLQERLGFRDSDRLLHGLYEALTATLGESEHLFRFATGEYVLTVPATENTGEARAGALRETVASTIFTAREHSQALTLSQAVCALPTHGFDPDILLRDARSLAHKLSGAGGDTIERLAVEHVDTVEPVVNDSAWKERIEHALAENGFCLAFQSIISLEDDSQRHFDVFLRMRGADGEEIKAGEFMPGAERLGLGAAIDRWVIDQVFELLAQRHASAAQSGLFIKLSPGSVADSVLLKWIDTQVRKLKIDPQQLVFQVRERLVHGHMNEVKALAQGLHKTGCRFAIDHFGDSGQALPALDHLPVDFIKLAPHLTQAVGETPQIHVKLRQIMERSQELKIKTIAEYVQNANAMAQLWQLGINFIQGNYVQPPEVVKPYGEVEAG